MDTTTTNGVMHTSIFTIQQTEQNKAEQLLCLPAYLPTSKRSFKKIKKKLVSNKKTLIKLLNQIQ